MTAHRTLATILAVSLTAGCYSEAVTYEIDEEYDAVVIEVDAGDVTLATRDRATSIDYAASRLGREPEFSATVEDRVLYVTAKCHDPARECRARVDLVVHSDVDITAWTGSADIDVAGTNGDLSIRSGSGSIDLHNASGTADLESGSGRIEGLGLHFIEVVADAGSGRLALTLGHELEFAQVHTGSGNIDLAIPQGGYDLTTSTGSGHVDLDQVWNDSQSSSTLQATSGSGDIDVVGL